MHTPISVCVCVCVYVSCSVISNPLQLQEPTGLFCPWNFPGKNTGVGCHSLLQGIFPTEGLNLGLMPCRQILYHLSHQGRPQSIVRVVFLNENLFMSFPWIRMISDFSFFIMTPHHGLREWASFLPKSPDLCYVIFSVVTWSSSVPYRGLLSLPWIYYIQGFYTCRFLHSSSSIAPFII